jgi:hypothetical protein
MSNEKQKTAVQQFWDKIALKLSFEQIDEFIPLFYQAEAIEKEQHANTWDDSRVEDKGDNYIGKQKSFNDYYEQTYGGNK